ESLSRVDVLIKPEKIVRIEFALKHHQTIVVFTVGSSHAFMAFIAQVVYVHTTHPKRAKNRVHFTGPGDVRFICGPITPYRNRKAVIRCVTVCVGSGRRRHSADGTTDLLEHEKRSRRRNGRESID